jgi:hypothetical protein
MIKEYQDSELKNDMSILKETSGDLLQLKAKHNLQMASGATSLVPEGDMKVYQSNSRLLENTEGD